MKAKQALKKSKKPQVNFKISDHNQSSEDYVDMSGNMNNSLDITYNPSYQISSWTDNAIANSTEAENSTMYECISTNSS